MNSKNDTLGFRAVPSCLVELHPADLVLLMNQIHNRWQL
jgi:hypothetical protein